MAPLHLLDPSRPVHGDVFVSVCLACWGHSISFMAPGLSLTERIRGKSWHPPLGQVILGSASLAVPQWWRHLHLCLSHLVKERQLVTRDRGSGRAPITGLAVCLPGGTQLALRAQILRKAGLASPPLQELPDLWQVNAAHRMPREGGPDGGDLAEVPGGWELSVQEPSLSVQGGRAWTQKIPEGLRERYEERNFRRKVGSLAPRLCPQQHRRGSTSGLPGGRVAVAAKTGCFQLGLVFRNADLLWVRVFSLDFFLSLFLVKLAPHNVVDL